jgi:M-phase inducer tyrosine phosphatase
MNDERHELACERGMAKVKSHRQKLFRHSTFAFGDTAGHDEEMQDSPTTASHGAGARQHAFRSHSSFEIGSSPSSFDALAAASPLGNPFQRRLASY